MDIEQLEQLALSTDRSAALASLLPGTTEHDYWRGVFLQHEGRLDEVDEILATWPKRHGRQGTREHERLERRQLLLRAQTDLPKVAKYIQREAGVTFEDRAEVVAQGERLPTALDPKIVDGDALLREELSRQPNLGTITDFALDDVVTLIPEGDVTRRRSLLLRLRRTNLKRVNMVDQIALDLSDSSSGGFGALTIHSLLTSDQLEELAEKMPALTSNTAWVDARLMRLRPPSFVDLRFDLEAKDAFLDRLWVFVRELGPTFNTLKAQVLFQRLELDRSRGQYDRARFIEYITLPRHASWVALAHVSQREATHIVQLNAFAGRAAGIEPIGSPDRDQELVTDYLSHFLATEEAAVFYPLIRDEIVDYVLASKRLTMGDPDGERWAKILGPTQLSTLRDRVDIVLTPRNPISYGADDDVTLEVDVKNVRDLEVKVFRINSLAYFQSRNAEVDTSLDLDGMIASGPEQKLHFDALPIRRTRTRIELPACKRPGTYIVELIGNGRSSRALIRKGSLRHTVRVGAAGPVVRIMDEQGVHLPNARVWLGGRELPPRKDGSGVTIPFASRATSTPILLVHGEIAQRAMLDHPSEDVSLAVGMHLERESVVANQVARMILQGGLTIGGAPASIALLEEARMIISVTDLAGTSSSKTQPIALFDDRETVVEVNIPDGTVRVDALLTGRVRVVSTQQFVLVQDRAFADINVIHTGEQTAALHLAKVAGTPAGNNGGAPQHRLSLLGKSGEPLPARGVALTFLHRNVSGRISTRLETDSDGTIDLGTLDGVHTLIAVPPIGGQRTWSLREPNAPMPSIVNAAVGDEITLQAVVRVGNATTTAADDFQLMELRSGVPAFDRTSHITIVDRCVVIKGLREGEYRLDGRGTASTVSINIARPVPSSNGSAGWLVAGNALYEETPPLPLVRSFAIEDDHVVLKISGATQQTRVHVIATRFTEDPVLPSTLDRTPRVPLSARSTRAISQYISGRDIGEEYRYVLERRSASRRPGTMLEKPSLLLNPWALRATATTTQTASLGVPYPKAQPAPMQGGAPGFAMGSAAPAREVAVVEDPGFPSVDFLLTGAIVLENQRPDENGILRISMTELGPSAQIAHVIVVDPLLTSRAELCLPARATASRDLRLRLALDPTHHYAEDRRVDGAPAGTAIVVDDVRTGKIELIDTIARAHQLLRTLGAADDALEKFSFVTEWPSLDDEKKRAKYSEYACHELHIFLWRKDRAFFESVVRPYLAHKRHKTFVDRYLLGEDLSAYLEPWAIARLNTLERILLGAALLPVQDNTVRFVGDAVDVIPRDPEADAKLVATLLGASALESDAASRMVGAAAAMDKLDMAGEEEYAARSMILMPEESQKQKKSGARSVASRDEPTPPAQAAAPAGAVMNMTRSGSIKGGGGLDMLLDLAERERGGMEMFRGADKTQEWAETGWWKRRIDELDGLIMPNRFWRDLANEVKTWSSSHSAGGESATKRPFLSPYLGDCTSSFAEAMCALAFLDLPFIAGAHEKLVEDTRLTFTPRSHALAARSSIVEIEAKTKQAGVLIGQSYFRSDDRWEWDGADQREKYVTGEMIAGVVYRCQVVVTNPTSASQKLDVLLQIPKGAVPVASGFFTRTMNVHIDPYGTESLEYAFYFPRPGRFSHFPAHVTKGLELQTSATARELEVVREPTLVDEGSWSYISQHGTVDQVIAYLESANMHRTDLSRIAWRMHDVKAFERIVTHLASRQIYDDGLWRYALMHRDSKRAIEWLRHQDDFLRLGGIAIDGPRPHDARAAGVGAEAGVGTDTLIVDPITRGWFQYLEYAPLINARAHQLGSRRRILNSALEEQYKAFLDLTAHHTRIMPSDLLGAAQYLLSMDRVEDAMAMLARVPPFEDVTAATADIATRLQLAYLMAYVACYRGDLKAARKHAAPFAEHPVDRWRHRFKALIAMLDEAEEKAPAAARATEKPEVVDPDNREQRMTESAAREPSLKLGANGEELVLQHHNVVACQLRFYRLDIELLFSRQPFVQGDVTRFSFIEPGLVVDVALISKDGRTVVAIPNELRGANLVIEAVAGEFGGLTSLITHYAHDLAVQVSPSFGQVRVLRGTAQTALPATYVKVYGRQKNGTVAFFKDGYTDLRGRFDYATLSTDDLDRVDRFSILVVSDDAGATIVEAEPPPR